MRQWCNQPQQFHQPQFKTLSGWRCVGWISWAVKRILGWNTFPWKDSWTLSKKEQKSGAKWCLENELALLWSWGTSESTAEMGVKRWIWFKKFQCEDGEAVGILFVLGALIWLPCFQLMAMTKREAQTSGVILQKNKQWTDSSSD